MRLGRRAALLALLLLALFTLSGLLALEAWSAAGKRRALAEQVMRQYASYAAAKYRDNVQGWLYVALDDDGRPRPVPPLLSETAADARRDEAARARQALRLARRDEARRAVDAPHDP